MKKLVLLIITSVTVGNLFCQNSEKGNMFIGGFFTYVPDNEQFRSNGDRYVQREYYYNINVGYQFAKRWKTGLEMMVADVRGENVPTPFYLTGLHVDFDVLQSEFINIYFRGGLSISNLSFAGDEEPTKRFVVNRIIGAAVEFKATKRFWINMGYYNHFPLNNIQYKYGLANPFLGFRFRFNK